MTPKVLVVGPSWVGDMVMAQALYRLLKERTPAPAIDVLAPRWSLPVLARMPEVARGIELDVAHGELGLGKRRAVGRRLRGEGYAQAIVLPRSAKAALAPWFARVPLRTGFRGEWRFGLLNDMRPRDPALSQTVTRFAALGVAREAAPGTDLPARLRPRLIADADNVARLRATQGLAADTPVAALMPGAEYGPAKRWPAERFGELAAALGSEGFAVVVLGSAKERELGERVRATAPAVRNLCGETALVDVVDWCATAAVAVSNDSGLMHVAAAAGTPVVAIYGSSSPAMTPPLTSRATVLRTGIDCSPCFARECPLGHLRCLTEIHAPDVLRAALELAAQNGPRP